MGVAHFWGLVLTFALFFYLSDGDSPYIDADANRSNLEYAITIWAKQNASSTDHLLIYLVDHGGPARFRLSHNEVISANDLNEMLDHFQSNSVGSVTVELLAAGGGLGQGKAEALFAAAELARDRLGAPRLARALFLEYAMTGSVWAGKAALAALSMSRAEAERREPLRQLARLGNDPYVMAADPARSGPVDLASLDADLQGRLTPLLDEAMVRAVQLDVLIRERSDTIGSAS